MALVVRGTPTSCRTRRVAPHDSRHRTRPSAVRRHPPVTIGGLSPSDAHELLTARAGGPVDDTVAGHLVAANRRQPARARRAARSADARAAPWRRPAARPVADRRSPRRSVRGAGASARSGRAARCCCWPRPNGSAIRRCFARAADDHRRWFVGRRRRERRGQRARHVHARRSSSATRSSAPPSTTPRLRQIVGAPTPRSPRCSTATATPIGARGTSARRRRNPTRTSPARWRSRRNGPASAAGASAAAFFLWRAAELTPDPDRAAERLLEAARAELRRRPQLARAGDPRSGQSRRARRPASTAEAAWTEALIHIVAGDVRQAAAELMPDALPSIDADQPELAAGACVAAHRRGADRWAPHRRADSTGHRRRDAARSWPVATSPEPIAPMRPRRSRTVAAR